MCAFVHNQPRLKTRQRVSPKTHTPERQLHISGRRYYNPELGRWVSRDPIEERGGLNVYRFVGNRAIDILDPYGHAGFSLSSIWSAIRNAGSAVRSVGRAEASRLEDIAGSLPSYGLSAGVTMTIGVGTIKGGVNLQFFPQSCEFGLYLYYLGIYAFDVALAALPAAPESVWNPELMAAINNFSYGGMLSAGVSAVAASPIGSGPHNANSWLGFFRGVEVASVVASSSVFGSSDWAGVSFGVGPGAGVEYNVTYFRYMPYLPFDSRFDVRSIPLVGRCLCASLRKMVEVAPISQIKAVLESIADGLL